MTVLVEHTTSVTLGPITVNACRDPDDNRILETAVLGHADTIVSGDKDLLSLGGYEGITIERPADCRARRGS